MPEFAINPAYTAVADQPQARDGLAEGLTAGERFQTLLGVTGSGKTATMAFTIEQVQRPALVIAHNKTLAAQLCNEFREFFPKNSVEYFVSYYDYYQPEAYVPAQDLYIEKDSSINEEIDRLRHSATAALFGRRDVVVVASVSCIYGLGSPEKYDAQVVMLKRGDMQDREAILRKLVDNHYTRNDAALGRGSFRVRGETLEGFPAYAETAYRAVFLDDFVCFIDESHQTVPQIGGMYEGDRSRKQTLVDYGFRLPSAMDNRPQTFDEFLTRTQQIVFVSATPGDFERGHSSRIVEQIVRPTGVVDPEVEVRETRNQIDDLMNEIRVRVDRDERVLVTTLTKKMSEDLTDYLLEMGFKVRYLHSEVDTLERIQIIRDLRLGEYDVLVGVNLLREGLDLPEVSLVAILDADKEGFLRGETALIQTIGRAARHINGKVLMYADKRTEAIEGALSETNRRRAVQLAYNEENGITPESIVKGVSDIAEFLTLESPTVPSSKRRRGRKDLEGLAPSDLEKLVIELEEEMFTAAEELRFEYAAKLRDEIKELRRELIAAARAPAPATTQDLAELGSIIL